MLYKKLNQNVEKSNSVPSKMSSNIHSIPIQSQEVQLGEQKGGLPPSTDFKTNSFAGGAFA